MNVVLGLRSSPAAGYVNFISSYSVCYKLGHQDFRTIVGPDNHTAQLLFAYFIAIQMLLVPIAVYEWPTRADAT